MGVPMDADRMTSLGEDNPDNAVGARAEEQHVGLVLSGWGGDEGATFNGRGTFAELFLRGRWRTLAREVAALKRERGWSTSRILYGEVFTYLVPDPVVALAQLAGRKPDLQTLFRRILSASSRQRLAASGDEWPTMSPDGRENRWRLMTSPHIAERAEVWSQTGARHGLAFAFPLLDRRVVEFSLSLPSELFLRGGFRRRPFRDAMADVLPSSVRLRHQKYDPFPSRMLDFAESKNELLAQIDAYGQNENVRSIIDLPHLRRLIESFPSPERMREEMRGGKPAASAAMTMAARALEVAAYLKQHGGSVTKRETALKKVKVPGLVAEESAGDSSL
jgi:asparagine synthase (glutamine-hydrolysing)